MARKHQVVMYASEGTLAITAYGERIASNKCHFRESVLVCHRKESRAERPSDQKVEKDTRSACVQTSVTTGVLDRVLNLCGTRLRYPGCAMSA